MPSEHVEEERRRARAGEEPGGREDPGHKTSPHEEAEEAAHVVEEDLDELTAARRERDEYLELAQRTRADFENYRKRVAGEAAEELARGKAELAQQLFPAIDNLERALRSAGVDPDAEAEADEPEAGGERAPAGDAAASDALAHGVRLVHRELRNALRRVGVESYDPAGEPFDPSLHEALATRSQDGAKPGQVLETVDRGYRLDGRVLRPARVIVSE